MGFLSLVPADQLAASYNPVTQSLTLYAKGEAQKFTYGITFKRLTCLGGLKLQLEGWTGPLGEGSSPFTHEQSFSIQLPSRALPSGDVIIVTLNHPEGEVIPIRWLGLKEPRQASRNEDLSLSNSETPTSSQLITANATQVTALFKMPFEIKQAAEVPKYGTVNITFDSTFLIIAGAGIDDRNIVWTFNSLQTGDTQVVVTVHGGIANYILQKTYNVHIFVLGAATTPTMAPSSVQAGTSSEPHSNKTLGFLGFVKIAVYLVQERYPDAQLYEVQATLPAGDPTPTTTNPLGLSQLQVVFRARSNGTVLIKSTGWGTWTQPQYIDAPWMESVVIPRPVEMDITDAVKLLRKAGYLGGFRNCTLRHPLGPPGKPNDEPYYIFQMGDGTYVFVGVKDDAIYVNKAGQALLPEMGSGFRV